MDLPSNPEELTCGFATLRSAINSPHGFPGEGKPCALEGGSVHSVAPPGETLSEGKPCEAELDSAPSEKLVCTDLTQLERWAPKVEGFALKPRGIFFRPRQICETTPFEVELDSAPFEKLVCTFPSAAHRDTGREWNVSKQTWNLY